MQPNSLRLRVKPSLISRRSIERERPVNAPHHAVGQTSSVICVAIAQITKMLKAMIATDQNG
jgi:hypothetical protein